MILILKFFLNTALSAHLEKKQANIELHLCKECTKRGDKALSLQQFGQARIEYNTASDHFMEALTLDPFNTEAYEMTIVIVS